MKAPEFWKKRSLAARLLYPFTFLYRSLAAIDRGLKRMRRITPSIPVISIGNIVVGGTGKTPLAAAVAQALRAHRRRVGIVSLGYGSSATDSTRVQPGDEAAAVGDEALELAQLGIADGVWSGPSRQQSIELAAQAGMDVVILDDGFQALDVKRAIDLVVCATDHPFGNRWLLPAGPLREPITNLQRASAVVCSDRGAHDALVLDCPVFLLDYKLSHSHAVRQSPIIAFCGLGQPNRWFRLLSQAGLDVRDTVVFPDHHTYEEADTDALLKKRDDLEAILVTTGKDAVKLPAAFRQQVEIITPRITAASLKPLIQFIEERLIEADPAD